jgi:hypothetical protein
MREITTKYSIWALVVVLLCTQTQVWAQPGHSFENQSWLYGKVVLASGDSLQGAVIYYPAQDVVQIASEDGAINSFSAVNVHSFSISGVYEGKPQLFRSLLWRRDNQQGDFRVPVFFEQVCQGPLVLLKRYNGVKTAKLTDDTATIPLIPQDFPHFATNGDELLEVYYVLLAEEEIVQLRNRKRELQRLFGDKSGHMRQYIRSNKLDFNSSKDLLTIINHYNSL